MNSVKKLLLASFAMAGLTACEDLSGTLEVKQPLSVRTKKEARTLSQGNYDVGISLKDSTTMVLKVKVPKEKSAKLTIKIPGGIPKSDGLFQSAAGANGQDFNVSGEMKSDYSNSPVSRSYRSCDVAIRERVCHHEQVTECGVNSQGEKICKTRVVPVCRDITRYIPGHEAYEGYTSYSSQSMRAHLTSPQDNALLAVVSTGHTDSHFVETWRSGCIMGPHHP